MTPLTTSSGGWSLPSDRLVQPGAGDAVAAPPRRAPEPAAPPGHLSAELAEVWISPGAHWTRVTLKLSSTDGQPVDLSAVTLAVSSDQGSKLALMPGLYDRAGVRQARVSGPVLLSCWAELPSEGRGDTAVRGTEQAAVLLLTLGNDRLRLRLPRR